MMRCHHYRDRVGHVDMLSFDLWSEGVNLLRDCGSYMYYDPTNPTLEKYFKSIWAHNTVVVDGQSPLRLASRFTYFPWPKADLLHFQADAAGGVMSGRHYAYARPPWRVVHQRTVSLAQGRWCVVDELQGQGEHELTLRWHLPPEVQLEQQNDQMVSLRLTDRWRLDLETPGPCHGTIIQGQADGGMESKYYGAATPITTAVLTCRVALPAFFRTHVYKEPNI